MRKYLKTVDLKIQKIMFKINLSLPSRISPTNTKLYDLENQGQGHYTLMTLENYCMNH